MPRSSKIVVGYGLWFSSETLEQAYKIYGGLYQTKKDAQKQISIYKKDGNVDVGETIKVFKVVVELIS